MKALHVNRKQINLEDYKLRAANESDYDTLITESTHIMEGDRLMIAYLELDMDCRDMVAALERVDYVRDFRTDGLPTNSRTFGYLPRNTLRKDFCTATSLANDAPGDHRVICEYAEKVNKFYREVNAPLYQQHEQTAQGNVLADYRIKSSVFTSGIINKNNPLKYHFDTGNFADVWSCMLVFKRDVNGGYLSVPEYGLGFELKNNSLFMFDGQGLLHGVTPIQRLSPRAFRYSVVYYSLRQMWNCQPISDELIRIRKLKTEREAKRAKPK